MSSSGSIASAVDSLREEIAAACAAAGRRAEEITLVAVSKTVPASRVREAHAAGLRDFGENRVQELVLKAPELSDLDFTWHMIGALQTNKVKAVLPHLGWLHSIDRAHLAETVSEAAARAGTRVAGLIQVNTTGEASKSGVSPEEFPRLLDTVRALPGIDLRGLMTIGPLDGTETEVRRAFALLRRLRDDAVRPDLPLPVLSMGMSDDFPLAILEGASLIRVGSRIFGRRG